MICARCGHELPPQDDHGGLSGPLRCIARLRADLEAMTAARDDALQRLAALRTPIPEATVSALLDDAARHLDTRVRDLQRELEAERARSWHGWMLATMWEGAYDARLKATLTAL